ncbi:MAG: TonB-dependent receptor [Planctomycetota bacterium]|nr:TonB-dependent receptor [Planctomycetota bacterium]
MNQALDPQIPPLQVCATLLALGLTCQAGLAQNTQQDPPSQQARPVLVTATRTEKDPLDVPYSTTTISAEDLQQRSYRTVPQALRDVPGVMIQETAHGHGSPYIRGFTSFRNLFLIDGIRLNNSVFRPGPNQYWNTVDAWSLERLEVVKGPSSVLYGTDAIGGTVHAITRGSHATPGPDFHAEGQTILRYSSAEDSFQARGEFSMHIPGTNEARTRILLGGTARWFGDLEGGHGVGEQAGTGYEENAIDLKGEHWFDDDRRLVFLHQRVSQTDVPRTHRTTDGLTWRGLSNGSDLRRDFDQDRQLTYLQYHSSKVGGMIDAVRTSLSWHHQGENRDRIRSNGNQEFQGFDVGTLGLTTQLESSSPVGQLTYGVEFYQDHVDSFLNRGSNGTAADSIQGPVADDARYQTFDAYLQDEIQASDRLEVTLGARFSYAAADADSVRDPLTNSQTTIHDNWKTVVGSLRLRYDLVPGRLHTFGGVSQGFRAPNFSDLSRFDSARSNEFEIPALDLDPEDYLSYELGLKTRTGTINLELSWFYVDIDDQILRYPTGNVNAAGESEVTKSNVGSGHVQGIELGGALDLGRSVTAFGNGTVTDGKVTNFGSSTAALSETYLTRLMPLTMQAGLRWEPAATPVWAETVVVHAEKADKLSFNDRRDTRRIPGGGTPSYTVWHLRAGWYVSDSTTFNLLLENVTDADYRVHGSGLNRPGRNLILGFTSTF